LRLIGSIEVFGAKKDPAEPPGLLTCNDSPFGLSSEFGRLGFLRGDRMSNPAAEKRALNSQISNGRSVMLAIMFNLSKRYLCVDI